MRYYISMQNEFKITPQSVHIWQVWIPELLPQIDDLAMLLDANEIARAKRLRFDEHRQRFIITRSILRSILSLYTHGKPKDIAFTEGARGKPFLLDNALDLQFNVSHSNDMAVYALTTHVEIGIDIEKIKSEFKKEVAKRFFSRDEYHALLMLPEQEQAAQFYYLWAGKEAIIKALGEGLYAPLSEFSLELHKKKQIIKMRHQQQEFQYHLEYFFTHHNYKSAFATAQSIHSIHHLRWNMNGPPV